MYCFRYPGGLKEILAKDVHAKDPTKVNILKSKILHLYFPLRYYVKPSVETCQKIIFEERE